MKVIKRDGRIKEFNFERIGNAIKRAYDEIYGEPNEKVATEMESVMDDVFSVVTSSEEEYLSVEDIQDIIIETLKIYNIKVANAYKEYRDDRQRVREYNTDTYKKIEKILNCDDIVNSNANIDETSFGGRKFEVAGVVTKKLALEKLIDKEVAKAHLENRGYIHDLDSYYVGMHNCSFVDIEQLLKEGFSTRNGDVRGANSLATAMQQIAVIFQVQSQDQYGGTGSAHIDYDLEPYVNISFRKYLSNGLKYFENKNISYKKLPKEDNVENIDLLKQKYSERVISYALEELNKEGIQSAQGLYHNLNTLESRPGSQVPFTSINFGRRTTVAGRMISEWLMKASIDGIGKFHKTSIFPISIFQYKRGINNKEGTLNYDLKKLAIKSMSKRIYPNWVNCDWSNNIEDEDNPDTVMATMGCRTLVGYDRHGFGYSKVGRGNVNPYTINLVKIGIENGICLGKREKADIVGFFKDLDNMLELATRCLIDRFNYICSQHQKSAPFMYKNKTMKGGDYNSETCIYDVLKHGSHAIGYIGIAEMCQAMFGKDHSDDGYVCDFAESVVKRIYDYCKLASEKYDLNFGCYNSPAESLCHTIIKGNREIKGLRDEYGVIPNVTDRDYVTNSHHIPVWKKLDIFTKLKIESRFTKYATSGCITYIELDSSIVNNPDAIEKIIDYAFGELDIPYLAFNFPIDACLSCGFQGEFNDRCSMCGSENIEQLRRVTGYLTTDYHKFNKGKQAEVKDRFKHSTMTKL